MWTVAAIALSIMACFGFLILRGSRENKSIESELQRLEATPEDEARIHALALLRNPKLFELKVAREALQALGLPPGVSEL